MVGITAAFEIWRGTLKSKMGNLDKPPLFDSNKDKKELPFNCNFVGAKG